MTGGGATTTAVVLLPHHYILAIGMLIFGSLNTIASEYQNSADCVIDGEKYIWFHPLFQTAMMFVGEMLCLIAYFFNIIFERIFFKDENFPLEPSSQNNEEKDPLLKDSPSDVEKQWLLDNTEIKKKKNFLGLDFNPLIFMIPAFCDCLASTLMFVGLQKTSASVYQMLRSASVIFTGLFSFLFLKEILFSFQILGLIFVVLGVTTVGIYSILGDSTSSGGSSSDAAIGDVCIIVAQVIVATQMVIERKFLTNYSISPLLVVGLEGVYGFTYSVIGLVITTTTGLLINTSSGPQEFDDALNAFKMIGNCPDLVIWCSISIFSIAFFNSFGIAVTSYLSATHRLTIDTLRTLIVWVFSMLTNLWMPTNSWQVLEPLVALQAAGFLFMVFGVTFFNGILKTKPIFQYEKKALEVEESINK
eukprot:TRINITY_DN67_c2_g1_i1.p1 TRINITY_DN67_c2_g1~~TRINITY_DN67_c2_g1_i1.p1  ORF type:complete len:430 (-),score=161.30 TRINITY_DN67_c2_g1_i1:98-1351(-)